MSTFDRQPSPKAEQPVKEDTRLGRRIASFRRLTLVLVAGAVLTIGFYVVLFVNSRVWQMLGEAGCLTVALVCAAAGYWLAGRGKLDAAGYLVLVGLLIGYGGNELVFAGATVYVLVGGVLLILLAGNLVLSGKWPIWLVFVAVYLGCVLAVNRFQPVQRYDIANSVPLRTYIPALSAVLVLGVSFQVVQVYGRIRTIGVRLVVTTVSLVLLVAIAVSGGSIWLGLRNAREQAFRRLGAMATLKASQIETWIEDLQLDLDAFFLGESELARMRTVLLWVEPSNPQDAQNTLRLSLQHQVDRLRRFDEVFLLNTDGEVVLSTNREREGQNYALEEWFERGVHERYVHPPTYDTLTGQTLVLFVRPVTGADGGDVLGVLVAPAGLDRLNQAVLERSGLGETGETYLVDASHTVVTELRYPSSQGEPIRPGEYVRSTGVDTALIARGIGSGVYDSYHGATVLGSYAWVPGIEAVLMAEQKLQEVTEGAQATVTLTAGILLASVLVAAGASVLVARSISSPLAALSRTATQIAAGDLALEADVTRQDETSTLAQAFNSMTAQLRDLIGGLEARVAGVTRNLEAAAEVSRATTSVLDPEALQRQVVGLIQERFGLYYVGLFLLDQAGEYAVLRAGTGEFGRVMLEQGHRLAVGGESMIGQSIGRNELIVLQGSGDDVVRFDNPLLPNTRSELALPMRARGRVIGAMTVQSDQVAAFDEQYIATLQTVADQVGVTLDNARNFAEVEASLARAQLVQQRYLGQAWREYVRRQPIGGYEYETGRRGAGPSMRTLGSELLPEVTRAMDGRHTPDDEDGVLVVPVLQGNQVIASLGFQKGEREWGAQEVALVQAVAEQLGLAAETQRLIEATQSRAAREQLTLRIAEEVRDAVDVEEILRVASRSLGRELNASEVVVRLGTEGRLLARKGERLETSNG